MTHFTHLPSTPQIDSTLPVGHRIHAFLQNTNNPYQFEVNGTPVQVRYKAQAPSLQQKITELCHQM